MGEASEAARLLASVGVCGVELAGGGDSDSDDSDDDSDDDNDDGSKKRLAPAFVAHTGHPFRVQSADSASLSGATFSQTPFRTAGSLPLCGLWAVSCGLQAVGYRLSAVGCGPRAVGYGL